VKFLWSTHLSKYFEIEKVIGIKQGVIYFENDPVGSNTFLICKKKRATENIL